MNGPISTSKNAVELLNSTLWVNLLRCVLSLNAMLTNALLLFLFARFRSLRKFQCNWLITLSALVEIVIGKKDARFLKGWRFTEKQKGINLQT